MHLLKIVRSKLLFDISKARPHVLNFKYSIKHYSEFAPRRKIVDIQIPSNPTLRKTLNNLLLKVPNINTNLQDHIQQDSHRALIDCIEKSATASTSSFNKPTLLDFLTLPNLKQRLFFYINHVNDIDNLQWHNILRESQSSSLINITRESVSSSVMHTPAETIISDDLKIMYILNKSFQMIQNKLQSKKALITNQGSLDDIIVKNPVAWFPKARMMKRKIIMHVGPTNSGKTYNALQRLKNCERDGYYAGPLRLLAREVYERFKSENIRCNLLTGEEIIQDLDAIGNRANITSGTVEMVPLNKEFEVVVLDEIQMMNDSQRGCAWSNIVLGCRAKELHLCGEKTVIPIIQNLVKQTGDSLEILEYDRLGELKLEESPMKTKNFFENNLKKGDCLIAFSKKTIIKLKLKIEKDTDFKVAVIYGSLPPETRLQQAKLFNEGHYDVLVASDAVGMGLNLSIKRILFTSNEKFDGESMIPLTVSNIKQIGGRAGRYKSESEGPSIGFVGATDGAILDSIKQGLESPIIYLKTMYVWPPDLIIYKMVEKIEKIENADLATLFTTLSDSLQKSTNKLFQLTDLVNRIELLQIIQPVLGLTFQDRLVLSNAPCKFSRPLIKDAFYNFCLCIAKQQTMTITNFSLLPFHLIDLKYLDNDEVGSLDVYEDLHQCLQLYSWMSNRWPNYLVGLETAKTLRDMCELIIFYKLENLQQNPFDKSNGRRGKFNKSNFRVSKNGSPRSFKSKGEYSNVHAAIKNKETREPVD